MSVAGAKEIDIAATLEHLRDQRPGMVQTKVHAAGPGAQGSWGAVFPRGTRGRPASCLPHQLRSGLDVGCPSQEVGAAPATAPTFQPEQMRSDLRAQDPPCARQGSGRAARSPRQRPATWVECSACPSPQPQLCCELIRTAVTRVSPGHAGPLSTLSSLLKRLSLQQKEQRRKTPGQPWVHWSWNQGPRDGPSPYCWRSVRVQPQTPHTHVLQS